MVVSPALSEFYAAYYPHRLYHSSLKNHGADNEADAMFEMGAETMMLPLEEKLKYEQGDEGISFG